MLLIMIIMIEYLLVEEKQTQNYNSLQILDLPLLIYFLVRLLKPWKYVETGDGPEWFRHRFGNLSCSRVFSFFLKGKQALQVSLGFFLSVFGFSLEKVFSCMFSKNKPQLLYV